ncbi:MAG: hypothetical protein ACRDSR_02415 [Pseudonocardiaceae bacterium]
MSDQIFAPRFSARLFGVASRISALPEVRIAVEANHDENRWWPTSIADPRIRMLVAGWSTRISYSMVDTYARVVTETNALGFAKLMALDDEELARLVHPLGLPVARIGYLRSLADFIAREQDGMLDSEADSLIRRFAAQVNHASFKVAQCAVLYARGYHCGIIPVDSGMVTRLGPALGVALPRSPIAHETLRTLLQRCVTDRARDYRELIEQNGYHISIPVVAEPTWWMHLVLIYFKRLHLNRPSPRLCPRRPICIDVIDCSHAQLRGF